jgi:hypothetical protein
MTLDGVEHKKRYQAIGSHYLFSHSSKGRSHVMTMTLTFLPILKKIASLECWDEVDDEKYGELGSGNTVDGEGN